MDWNAAIEKNREALKRVLAMLVAMAGLGGGETTMPRHLHRAVLGLLRPAEAAARRLIIVTARGLVVALPPARPRKSEPKQVRQRKASHAGIPMLSENLPPRAPSLPLLDPLQSWSRRARPAASGVPRISVPGFGEPFAIVVRRPPSPDDPVNAARLALRLEALASALDDLPGQARRFARWRARRADAASAQDRSRAAAGAHNKKSGGAHRVRRVWPLRPGRPPGWRQRPDHEVHEVLNVVHGLAFWALESPDTS
jgi:hypothetical protein